MIELRGRRIALIGGAGFVGHHMALHLRSRGAEVSIIDGLQVNNLLAIHSSDLRLPNHDMYEKIIGERLDLVRDAGIPMFVQDAQDYHALSRILTQIQPQVIVHLAAVAHAGRSNKDPYSTFGHSLRTLENALDNARDQIEHFVYLSSSLVYGDFKSEEVDEADPLEPIGIYGALKVAGEKIVIAYQQVFDLPFTIIRPSALYGPRCVSRRVGQIFIENAMKGATLRVEGDGEEKLDFTYIDDLIQGVELVITNPNARNEIFNLTYGGARKIADLLALMKEHFPDVEIERAERDRLMPLRGTLNVTKARRLLHYAPRHPIEVGFPKYIAWYEHTFPGYQKAMV